MCSLLLLMLSCSCYAGHQSLSLSLSPCVGLIYFSALNFLSTPPLNYDRFIDEKQKKTQLVAQFYRAIGAHVCECVYSGYCTACNIGQKERQDINNLYTNSMRYTFILNWLWPAMPSHHHEYVTYYM